MTGRLLTKWGDGTEWKRVETNGLSGLTRNHSNFEMIANLKLAASGKFFCKFLEFHCLETRINLAIRIREIRTGEILRLTSAYRIRRLTAWLLTGWFDWQPEWSKTSQTFALTSNFFKSRHRSTGSTGWQSNRSEIQEMNLEESSRI